MSCPVSTNRPTRSCFAAFPIEISRKRSPSLKRFETGQRRSPPSMPTHPTVARWRIARIAGRAIESVGGRHVPASSVGDARTAAPHGPGVPEHWPNAPIIRRPYISATYLNPVLPVMPCSWAVRRASFGLFSENRVHHILDQKCEHHKSEDFEKSS